MSTNLDAVEVVARHPWRRWGLSAGVVLFWGGVAGIFLVVLFAAGICNFPMHVPHHGVYDSYVQAFRFSRAEHLHALQHGGPGTLRATPLLDAADPGVHPSALAGGGADRDAVWNPKGLEPWFFDAHLAGEAAYGMMARPPLTLRGALQRAAQNMRRHQVEARIQELPDAERSRLGRASMAIAAARSGELDPTDTFGWSLLVALGASAFLVLLSFLLAAAAFIVRRLPIRLTPRVLTLGRRHIDVDEIASIRWRPSIRVTLRDGRVIRPGLNRLTPEQVSELQSLWTEADRELPTEPVSEDVRLKQMRVAGVRS